MLQWLILYLTDERDHGIIVIFKKVLRTGSSSQLPLDKQEIYSCISSLMTNFQVFNSLVRWSFRDVVLPLIYFLFFRDFEPNCCQLSTEKLLNLSAWTLRLLYSGRGGLVLCFKVISNPENFFGIVFFWQILPWNSSFQHSEWLGV